jgi:hypothetical protein
MPLWQVVVVLNLTFAVGLGLGYAGWGRRVGALEREVTADRVRIERLEREREACAAGARAGEQQWEGRGLVRAVYPRLLVITHEQIQGLLPARTTGFAVPATTRAPRVGDAVRFSLRGTAPDDAAIVGIEGW